MFTRKSGNLQSRIDSLIGAGTTIQGDVTFEGGLRVDGCIRGDVATADGKAATLVLSEHSKIEGEVRVSHVVINGCVAGAVHASEYIELQPKANVSGDVYYQKLEIHLGAVLQGKLIYLEAARDDKVVPFKSATVEL